MSTVFKKPSQAQLDSFKNRDVLSAADLTKEDLEIIMNTAGYYEQQLAENKIIKDMEGKVMASLFYEPSTRTRLSFETAMLRLGGSVITVAESATNQTSSTAKGETIHDGICVIDGYADVIVIRNPVTGTAQVAANAAEHPVINAGDGAGQHPTQALLDIYTIIKEKGKVEGLKVALVGDLKYGRTVHSLVEFLAIYGCEMILASPDELKMPEDIVKSLKDRGLKVTETNNLKDAVVDADVLYVTRVQRERFPSLEDYEKVKDLFIVDEDLISGAKDGMIILHPLPRVNEITVGVDKHPGALYFKQAHNGLYVRMALLALTTGSVR
ncbi:MAG: aspartate carbamoyltransferase [Bacillota bacterium]|jgi:aspartate carbamoyltransferase catalytic subunit